MSDPVNVGVVGMHGYARSHLNDLLQLRDAGRVGRLSAVAHAREQDPAWVSQLEGKGVHLLADLDALLAEPGLHLVTLPVGIHLHLSMAQRVLNAGFPVFLEKPAAGCLADFDLLTAHPRADRLLVGFQHLFMPSVRELRQRLANGEFGALRRIVITCATPRDHAYYARNRWAGRLVVDGITVRDSPANNACSHYLNLAMFLAGGQPIEVRAALAHAYPIDSFDTCGICVRMAGGTEIVFNASHAGTRQASPRLRIECADATIIGEDAEKPWSIAGVPLMQANPPPVNAMRHALAWMQGGAEPVCTLGEARAHCRVIEAVHETPIAALPSTVVERLPACIRCPALDEALNAAHDAGVTLDEVGMIPGLVSGVWTPCRP